MNSQGNRYLYMYNNHVGLIQEMKLHGKSIFFIACLKVFMLINRVDRFFFFFIFHDTIIVCIYSDTAWLR